MSKNKRLTNVEFVTQLMEFSRRGALAQAFVIEAIGRYAREITSNETFTRESMRDGLIDADAWIDVAREVKTRMAEQYGGDI
jgi:hypothetical protein